MSLLPGLLQPSTPAPAAQAATRVQVTLAPGTTAQLERQLEYLPLPQTLTVGPQNEDGTTPLTLSSGGTVNARISPPLNPGSQLTLSQMPAAAAEGSPATVMAQLTLAAAKGVRPEVLQQAVRETMQGPTQNPPTLNMANVQVVGGNVQAATPNVLPAGPVLVNVPMPQVVQLLQNLPVQTPLQLMPNGQPMTAEGQPAFLSGGGLPRFVPVMVQAGQPLPTNKAVTVLTAEPSAKGLDMVMTLAGGTPFTAPAGTTAPAQPLPVKAQMEGLRLMFGMTGNAPAPVLPQAGTPFAARVLTPPLPAQTVAQMGLPAGTVVQTALLSTGDTVQLVLPPAPQATGNMTGQATNMLPTGTVLTMALDFSNQPVGTSPTVLRLSPANAQPQPHQNMPQAAPHTPTQTVQAPPPAGALVSATVTGQTASSPPQALLTLNTPPFAGQTFTLPVNQSLPVGTQVQLQFGQNLQATLLNFVLPPNFMRSQAATTLAHQWPTLTQALNASPSMGAAQNVPTPLTFLATFLPYMKGLLDNQAEAPLTKEAAMKAAALGLDFGPDLQQLTSLAAKPESPEQWRGVLFPYIENAGEDPRQGRFFWRQQKQEQENETKTSTRFVLEISLSNMGDLQLDGLVNYPEIWLKLRGHKPFSPEIRQGIAEVVTNTLTSLGLTGGIGLEETPVFTLNPLAELLREDPTSLNLSL